MRAFRRRDDDARHHCDRARDEEEEEGHTWMISETATFRRASRCFRRETIVSCLRVRRGDSGGENGECNQEEREREREDRERQMAQRIVAALFLRPYVRRDQDADDRRPKGRRLQRSGKTM